MALCRMWCVFWGSHRASVDCLWQHLTSVHVCMCIHVYMRLSLCGSPVLSHNPISCGFQCGSFPVIKFHLTPAAVHGKELVIRVQPGFFVRFTVMWQQVWTGMQPAVNHYHQGLSISSLQKSDIMLTHQPLSATV